MKINKLFKSAIVVSIILTLIGYAFAQGSWSLGPYSFITGYSSGPLNATMGGSRGLNSYSFVGAVGGVAFESVAHPDGALRDKNIALYYDKSKSDGYRLIISIDKKSYQPYLPDWQLIPIAKYADSEYNACVSLFGKNTDENSYDIVYHSAFENTLLGMRLLQADIILMDINEFWQLPKYNGEMVLGLGESLPDNTTWRNAASEINRTMRGEQFQSWVYTDYGVDVEFSIQEEKFQLTGYPYYYFIITDFNKYNNDMETYKESAQALRNRGELFKYNEIVREANALRPKVSEAKSLTSRMKLKSEMLQKINPTVYHSSNQTMRFAAFFRYIKSVNKLPWDNFLSIIKRIKIEPSVITPTKWSKPK